MTTVLLLGVMMCGLSAGRSDAAEPIDIGSRLELFVDDFLIDRMKDLELELHHPTFQNVAVKLDKPWEGNIGCYITVFKDKDKFRMYYRGANWYPKTKKAGPQRVCYAESTDGKTWTKPQLGIIEVAGSKANNLIWEGDGSHNFTPFKDPNPDCKPDEKYKAVATVKGGLGAFKSKDGIHWSRLTDKPIITKGAFDSQNLAFYDTIRKEYRDYHRMGRKGVRDIMTCTSKDFRAWTDPVFLDYGDAKPEHLYTNAIRPYYRAPHIFMGFPKRFRPKRRKSHHHYPGVSDGVFMTSRDGLHFHRWQSAFLRPGLQESRWENRNNMIAWGMLETASDIVGKPNEITPALHISEAYAVGGRA